MDKNIFKERRSVKFFDKTKPLENDLLKKVIDTAVLAPSAFNLQPWRIIAVQSEDAKQRLYNAAMKQGKVLDASVVLIIIADNMGWSESNPMWNHFAKSMSEKRLTGSMKAAAKLYGKDEYSSIKYAQSNTGLLAMSVMYAAKYYGVDSHPMSGMDSQLIKTEFRLKPSEDPVMLICLGYFDDTAQLSPRDKRRGFDEIVEFV